MPTSSAATETIDQNGHVFAVVYTCGEVTVTGIADDANSMNVVLCILAGLCAVVAGGTGVYGYRRKKENG